ncbi:MAG: hypothetical protein ABIO35_05115, partial [Nitrobacter sp.]
TAPRTARRHWCRFIAGIIFNNGRCGHLTSDEARRIANAIARVPEFMQRRGFHPRVRLRWKPGRPYHVALEDGYVRAHWDEINTICQLNSIPFNATGEKIHHEGCWCVYEFTWQVGRHSLLESFPGSSNSIFRWFPAA